jgi:hypothetical protein
MPDPVNPEDPARSGNTDQSPDPGAPPPESADSAPIVPASGADAVALASSTVDEETISPDFPLDAPMPPQAPITIGRLRRPPRVFRRLREWVQTRLMGLVTALGEFMVLFAFVISVILGSIFVLTNRIVNLQVMTPGKMGGSYAPDNRARYTSGAIGQAFAVGFDNGLPSKPIPISASGAALPAVRPKLADEARAENSARDALLASGGGFQASADTKAALSAPILSGKLLASLAAKGAGGEKLVIPTRNTGPAPTRSIPTASPTPIPTPTTPGVRSPTVAPTRPATTPSVVPTVAGAGNATVAPSATPPRTATSAPIVVVSSTAVPPSPSVRASVTPLPPSPTVPARSPTAAVTAATSPSPVGGTPTIPTLPTVTAAPASPTVPVPPSPTTAFSPTPNVSPTPRPPPSPTVTNTPTQTPTQTATPTPTRVGGPSPTALAVLDLSKLVVTDGAKVVTNFPGIFSTGSTPDPNTGVIGASGPLAMSAGKQFSRTLLFVNAGDKPIYFVSQTGPSSDDKCDNNGTPVACKESALWADIENGLQMEITIDGVTRYLGPLDTTRAPTPPYLERIPGNDIMSIGFRIFLPPSAGNDMARQVLYFDIEFVITRY